ncbi:hypothetical protein N9174_04695, partial [bacterium]|nr:hypothetical protein [bacterium]
DENPHYWLSEDYRWAPKVVLLFKELLMTGNGDRMMELTKSLRQQMKPRCSPWVRREWLHRLRGKVSFSKYLLAGMKLRRF